MILRVRHQKEKSRECLSGTHASNSFYKKKYIYIQVHTQSCTRHCENLDKLNLSDILIFLG